MSSRYYQSQNSSETINKEFLMDDAYWYDNSNSNAINSNIDIDDDMYKYENELNDYPSREFGEKCGEIFILNCSGDVIYSCQFCNANYTNIGKLIKHCYEEHGFQDNRPKETINDVLIKNQIDMNEGNGGIQNISTYDQEIFNQNIIPTLPPPNKQYEQSTQIQFPSNLPKLIQSGQKILLLTTPVLQTNNNALNQIQQQQQLQIQQNEIPSTSFGMVNTNQYTNNYIQMPQNQELVYQHEPLQSALQQTFFDTNNSNNIVGANEHIPISNIDNFIEFDGGSNSNQSPANIISNVANVDEIIANYQDDHQLQNVATEQYIGNTEEGLSQCGIDQEPNNKIEALIEELVNSNSNSQQYIADENSQTQMIESGEQPTYFLPNHSFFNTVETDQRVTENQQMIAQPNQNVILNADGVQQNFIFDGTHLQPTNFMGAETENNQPNYLIKFSENDGNIYLVNNLSGNLNLDNLLQDNSSVQFQPGLGEGASINEMNTNNSVVPETNEINETNVHQFLNSSAEVNNILAQNITETVENIPINCIEETFGTVQIPQQDNVRIGQNLLLNNYQNANLTSVDNVVTETVQATNFITSGSNIESEFCPVQTNKKSAMEIKETNSAIDLNLPGQNLKSENSTLVAVKCTQPNFLENFQKFLEKTSGDNKEIDEQHAFNANMLEDDEESDSISKESETTLGNWICKTCGKTFREENHLRSHKNKSKAHKCEMCRKEFCGIKLYNKHIKSHGNINQLKCELCSSTFRSQHNLEMHMKNHSDVRPFKCDICKSTFRTKHYLDLHMNRHLGKKPFACNFCERCFYTGNERTQHESNHISNGSRYRCKHCEKEFLHRFNLTLHIKNHIQSSSSGSFECDICQDRFQTEKILQDHLKSHSIEESIGSGSNGRNTFTGNSVITENIPSNSSGGENSFNTNKNFNTTNYNLHLNSISDQNSIDDGTTSQTFICQYCEESFISILLLEHHLKSIHSNDSEQSNFVCPKCQKEFSNHMDLVKHSQLLHNNDDEIDVVL